MSDFGPLTYREAYWGDRAARDAFYSFIRIIHNLDFGLWESAGCWDERYRPFSLFEGDRVVSSVCLYSMDMVVGGRRMKLSQISGVGTLPEFRRKGLNRKLTRLALEWAKPDHQGTFLFADDDAIEFYAKCGFQSVPEILTVLPVAPPAPKPGLRQLDVDRPEDLAMIFALASERVPVSDRLGTLNPHLLMFHALYTLRKCAYHLPALDLVVFFHREAHRLRVFDIVGRRIPPFAELHPYLSAEPHREVAFYFMTDKLDLDGAVAQPLEGNNTHILPGFPMATDGLTFPFTVHA